MPSGPFHVAIALDAAGWHPRSADEPGAREDDQASAGWWTQIIGETDHESIAFVTIADRHRRGDDGAWARLDALLLACRVAPVTRTVGIVPGVATTLSEPFFVSTQLATLDHISGGRAGWEVDVSLSGADGGYVGPRAAMPAEQRYAEADEHVEAVRRLWDSWEDDAEIRDAASHRFIDRHRIHHINFSGRHLSVSGPSITPRPPQGQPMIATVACDARSDRFAATRCDVAFLGAGTFEELSRRLPTVRGLRTATGRTMLGPLCFAEVAVFLDQSRAGAERRRARLDAGATRSDWPGLIFTGTPAELAAWLLELAALGCDGARLHPAALPHDLLAITHELAPLLPRPVSPAPPAVTLRERLGFERLPSRYTVLT